VKGPVVSGLVHIIIIIIIRMNVIATLLSNFVLY